jgi:hypothetical protein
MLQQKLKDAQKVVEDIQMKILRGKNSFYPEEYQDFYNIIFSDIDAEIIETAYNTYFKSDFDAGLAFKTRPEAEAKLAEMQAITKVRKFIFDNNMSFEPDWLNYSQKKCDIYYNIAEEEFESYWLSKFCQKHSPFGHLKSEADCEKVIDGCEEELKIIFNIKK